MARSECGPDVTTDGQGDYDVLPSQDTTGYTDPQDIQCALNHMRSGGVTTLGAGDFYLADGVMVTDVQGTFRGAGRDATTLHALDDFDADLCGPGDEGYTGAPSDALGWIRTYMVAFFYDGHYSGALTVSDLAVRAEGDAVVFCDHGKAVHDGVKFGVAALANTGLPAEHYDPDLTHDMDLTFEHLKATGQVILSFYEGSTLAFPYAAAITTSGDVKMADIVADGVGTPQFVGYTEGAHIAIGGSDQDAIVGRNISFVGGGSHPYGDNDISVSHVDTEGPLLGVFVESAYPGNTVSITDNTIEGAWGLGVAAVTYDPTTNGCCSSFDISHNVIRSDKDEVDGIGLQDGAFFGSGVKAMDANVSSNSIDVVTTYGGIFGLGVQDAVISNNTIVGQMVAGIYMSLFGEPVQNCALLGNNVQGVQPNSDSPYDAVTPAQIFLGWGTKDCSVVGDGHGATVIDDGQDNLLTGVTNLGQGQALGSDVQDAMDSKGAELTKYGPADVP